MRNELKENILYSALEKIGIMVAQFFTSVFISKYLPREDFGAMAVIAGSFAFVQLINLSLENNLYKEHRHLNDENINGVFGKIMTFNILKVILLLFFSIGIAAYYSLKTSNPSFNYIVSSYFLITSMDILVAPFITFSTIKFQQKMATKISLVRWSLNLIGVVFLVVFPKIEVLFYKDLVIWLVILFIWKIISKKKFSINFKVSFPDKAFILNYFIGYSFWTHLTAVASSLIYKADGLILFYFVGLKTIGNYNIALTLANVASIIPSILVGQNNVALANTEDNYISIKIASTFLVVSIVVGLLSFIAFLVLGLPYIHIVSKEDHLIIFQYLLLIVSGVVLVKSIVSPLVSYINIKGDVKSLFYKVSLPVLIFSLLSYTISAYLFGAMGVACANFINGIFWLLLIFIEIKKYNFKIPNYQIFKNEIEKMVIYAKNYSSKA